MSSVHTASDYQPLRPPTLIAWAIWLAETFPTCGFYQGNAYEKELDRVIKRLGLRRPASQMTDDTCIHCRADTAPHPDLKIPDIYSAYRYIRNEPAKGSARNFFKFAQWLRVHRNDPDLDYSQYVEAWHEDIDHYCRVVPQD